MKKKPILNAYETKLFNDWIEDGNAFKNDKGVWLEQTTQYSKKFTYDELQNFFKREYLAEGYNGGGRVKTKEYFQIYKLEDLRRKTELLLTDVELSKFLDSWNFDYNTDYNNWVEFNEYEDSAKITPVFSKNEYGGNVNNSFVESEINSVSTWENEEIATYLEVPVNEVAKHRDYYVEETQNAMLVNQVDGDYAKGGEVFLDKKYNFDDYGIKSYRELIDAGKFRSKFKSISNASDFDRIKFNRMRGKEQVEYVRKLNKQKIQYNLKLNNAEETFYTVKKEVFDYANIPETEEQNFYTKFDEPTGFIFADGGMVGSEIEFNHRGELRMGKIYEGFENNTYAVQSGTSKILVDKDDILRTIKPKKETSFSFFDDGGGVGEFPPKGELTNKDNFLLKYEKKGGEYEFFVYKPITKEVSGYNQIKHVCLNKDCPQKMNYEQFINYLYAELYLDDTQYAGGGDVPHADKMFQLPLEMVIYVPSTQDVDKVISVDKMDKRVDEVKIYLANKFGGYTSADKLGGFVDSTGNLVNEDVVQVTSFSTKEAYAENKEELINQLAKWGEEWGQESIGFEFEGDLMYVPQKFKKGGEIENIKVGDEIYARWTDSSQWTLGTFKGETKNGFEVYDRTIERPEYIEYYSQISKLPHPYGNEKTFYSKNFKDRNYKNYHFIKEIQEGNYKQGGESKKIGFKGLANKVANRYEGKKVAPKFQSEYGKTYSKEEAQEVGNKVAGKVYREQQSNKLADGGGIGENNLIKNMSFDDIVFSITKALKEKTYRKENNTYYFDINTPSASAIYWRDLSENKKWSIGYDLKYPNFVFVSILDKTFRAENIEDVLAIIKRDDNVSSRNYYKGFKELEIRNLLTFAYEDKNKKWNKNLDKYADGGKLKEYNHLKEYYEKYVNGGFVGGDIIKFKFDGKEFTRKVESVDDMGNALVNLMKTQKATINPADIFDIKKDFSEKDVIIKKIGLNENLAEYLVSVSPTFAVWFADAIVENEIEERQESKEVVLKAINEKSISKNTNYFNNNFGGAIREILDWLQHPSTPKQNLRDLTFNEALEKSRQWHQELTTSGGDLNFVEPEENTVLITYPPNEFGKTYYWVFIPKNYCDIESSRMGHCGRTGAGSLISLRSFFTNINNESVTDSHVTIAYNKDDGLFYQAKGKQNRKPVEKYFPYIFNLIKLMASGKIEEEYKLKIENKLNDLRSKEKKAQAGLEKIKKYFQSKEARTENAESLVEKANKLVSIREKLNEIAENIKMLDSESRFDFNGFGSEYQSSNDYGYEDFTTEQIKELYPLKPEIFKDFAGEYMLYQAGVVSEKPNTIFTLEKPVEYVSDLLRLNRDFSDDFVRQVLTGDTDDLFSGDYSYYYNNAGEYVDDLNKEDYDKVLNEIVEITQLDKEIIKENGAKYYLDGDDEEFSADNFGDIKTAIANSLEGAVRSGYENYYYNQIKDALQELGTVKELNDEGVILEIDLANLISIGEISSYMKDLDSDSLQDVFFEAESNSGIELPSLNIDDRYEPYPDNWQDTFNINNYAEGGAVYPDLSMQKAQVVNDSIRIPEFELKQAKEVVVIEGVTNTKILGSDDANKIFRNIWGKDTIKAYEQCYVLYLNKANKVIGYYHHSAGGIDGTVMDIEMISGMAVKSLSKGVMIAHNHPSGNTTPSDSDKNITKQLYQALKLFNITLLDSIILTEDSYLSFANEGLL